MKYRNEVIINLPRSKVVEIFNNPDNMKYWQEGLLSFETISGKPGKEGAKSKLKFKMGNREIDMIETITTNNLPNEFHGTYETNGVYNIVKNWFKEVDSNSTKWESENEFKMSGFMKIIGWLFPGSFKKQSQKIMNDFKKFAEGN
jgi:hypothetical protein